MKRPVDLSHRIEDGLVTYRGLPAPVICDYLSREDSRAHYAEGTSFHIGRIEMVANTGTYIDAPFHRYADGADISELDLESIAEVDAVVVSVGTGVAAIDDSHLEGIDVSGKAVLFRTGWSRHWKTDRYFEGHPYLTESAAVALRGRGARLAGIDSYNIDDIGDGRRPVHTVLLRAGVPIVEHLCRLEELPDSGFTFSAVPAGVRALGTFPVRAYAMLGE